ncbi:type VI secretion system lipoprotein TssJ [Desulfogranum mediterraneum]|uniref:type VI secretion system lipoprotein TssJ n=1 Tax=Desulfogranum mediterraneum TaxID=160661 RepID=UPI00048E3179|nr:type VI secretion system lipoprotein TssJ [Desulfogranum mediterraneum]
MSLVLSLRTTPCAVMVVLLLCLFLVSCGAKQDPPPQLDYAKAAITVNYQADKELNFADHQPHTLLLVIYQLSEVNAFNSYVGYRQGLVKLLQAASFDPSVTALSKHYIEPGSSGLFTLDRAAKTQHLGIVAGYHGLDPEKSADLIPLSYETGRHGWLLTKSTTVKPLHIKLVLEKDRIRRLEDGDDS